MPFDRWIAIVLIRLRSLVRARAVDRELDEELQDHLARQTDANIARGMTPDDARRAALAALGGVTQQREICRDARGWRWLLDLQQDVRYAWRAYRKTPAFTLTALLTLALAIGSNAAIFSLLNALVLRELPVRDPDALVKIETLPGNGDRDQLSYDMFTELTRRQQAFSSVVGWWGPSVTAIEAKGRFDRAGIFAATGNIYETLGLRPVAGRLLSASDMDLDPPRADQVAVLGYDCWQRLFHGDPAVVGQIVRIETVPFTIVGVTPPGFTGFGLVVEPEITIPLTAEPLIFGRRTDSLSGRSTRWITTIGRLRPGESLTQAQAQLGAVWPRVREAAIPAAAPPLEREEFSSLGLSVSSAATGIEPNLRNRFTRPLVVVMGVGLLIMLIACLNLSGLVLARTTARHAELGLRLALGASGARVARQLLTEALLLTLAGTAAGLFFAYAAAGTISAAILGAVTVPVAFDPAPDGRVFAFAAALAIAAATMVSLVPAWRIARRGSAVWLRRHTRTTTGTRGAGNVLTVAQVAATVVLLMAGGLLVRTLQELRRIDLGWRAEHVTVAYPDALPGGYTHLDNDTYLPTLAREVANVPGVSSVAFSLFKPGTRFGPEDRVSASGSTGQWAITAAVSAVSPGFFRSLDIRLLQGRDFAWSDNSKGRRVALISRSLAEQTFGASGALGRHLRIGSRPPYQDVDIIGVVSDARLYDMRSGDRRAVYTAALQQGTEANYKAILIRADRLSLPDLRTAVAAVGHETVFNVESLAGISDYSILPERLAALLAGFFGLLALAVAGIGLYGRMSYEVAQRAREIGIRMALGAEWRRVLGGVMRDGLVVAGAGAAIGFVAGLGAVRLVRSLLFGVGPYDPVTLAGAVGLLLVIAVAACARPALRAARLDPLTVLRQE